MQIKILVITFFVFFTFRGNSQETIGLLLNDEASYNGYTLFTGNSLTETFLIDNCGEVINQWQSTFVPAFTSYLLDNGNLLRSIKTVGATGNGGVEIWDWDNNLVWSLSYSDSLDSRMHHDIEPMPNGNILLLVSEEIPMAEAVLKGRNSTVFTNTTSLRTEKIIEIKPLGIDSFSTVWEWRADDHVIQNWNPMMNNFGNPFDYPERLDINYSLNFNGSFVDRSDWLHANHISYNETLDQIIISSRHFNEFWIIDHSTTTEEAASHSGGNAGKGGDILYRWGNPHAYGRDTWDNRKLFGPHGTDWIQDDAPDAQKIIVFNNGVGRTDGIESTIEIIDPPIDALGNYTAPGSSFFLPATADYSYTGAPDNNFGSGKFSNAQQLPNGNILVCSGALGELFEVDPQEKVVWRYINPVGILGPVDQGGSLPASNAVFKVQRFSVDHPAFVGKDLTPMGPLELNPFPSDCMISPETTSTQEVNWNPQIRFNNLIENELRIENRAAKKMEFQILDAMGRIIQSQTSHAAHIYFDLNNIPSGIYFLKVKDDQHIKTYKLLRQ